MCLPSSTKKDGYYVEKITKKLEEYEVSTTKMSLLVEKGSLFQPRNCLESRVPSWSVVVIFGAKDDPHPRSRVQPSANVMAQAYEPAASFVSNIPQT